MITIFNRKELIVTASMEKQAEVRDILAKNHMPYEVKTVNRSSGSALGGRTRDGNWDMRKKNRNLCMNM